MSPTGLLLEGLNAQDLSGKGILSTRLDFSVQANQDADRCLLRPCISSALHGESSTSLSAGILLPHCSTLVPRQPLSLSCNTPTIYMYLKKTNMLRSFRLTLPKPLIPSDILYWSN